MAGENQSNTNTATAETQVETQVEKPETTVNWEQKYNEDIKKYDGYDTYKGVAEGAYQFFQKYPELRKGYDEFNSGKDWKPNFAPAQQAENKPQFDPNEFKRQILEEVQPTLTALQNETIKRQVDEEEKYLREKYKFSDDERKEIDKRFAEKTASEIKDLMMDGKSRQQATEEVRGVYRRFGPDQLVALLMPEKLAASVRKPNPLAPGMTSPGNNAGPAPKALEQARKEYRDSPKGDASASVVQKWAEQFGLPMAEAHKLLQQGE